MSIGYIIRTFVRAVINRFVSLLFRKFTWKGFTMGIWYGFIVGCLCGGLVVWVVITRIDFWLPALRTLYSRGVCVSVLWRAGGACPLDSPTPCTATHAVSGCIESRAEVPRYSITLGTSVFCVFGVSKPVFTRVSDSILNLCFLCFFISSVFFLRKWG